MSALLAAWIGCGWKVRPRNEGAVNLLARTWLRTRDNFHEVVSDLKASCHQARLQSLTGRNLGRNTKGKLFPRGFTPSADQLYQISCLSRALPLPDEKVEAKALEDFKNIVLEPVPLTEKHKFIHRFFFETPSVVKTIDRFKKKYKRILGHFEHYNVLGASANALQNRREGGRTGCFAEASRWAPPPPWLRSGKLPALKWMEFGKTRTRAWFKREIDNVESRVVTVKERGFKARIVTKNNPWLVSHAHAARECLYPLVTKGKRTILEEPPLRIRLKGRISSRKRVYSFDLKAATDTICHPFLDQLCAKLGIDPKFVHANFVVFGKPVKRGAFMGMPLSWSLLEWTHHTVCWILDPLGDFVTKGDDGLAYWPQSRWKYYRMLMSAFGYIVNLKKTFITLDRGTFCERLYVLEGNDLVQRPTYSFRSASGSTDWVSAVSQFSHDALKRGCDPPRTNRMVNLFWSKQLEQVRRRRIPLNLPNHFGGLGLVPDDPQRALSKYETRLFWGLLDKEVPGMPPYISSPIGPNLKRILRMMNQLKWRSGVQGECPELQTALRRAMAFASCADVGSPMSERSKPSSKLQLDALVRIRKKASGSPRGEVSWRHSMSVTLKPTYASIQGFWSHQCNWGAPENR
jgi:hypothetical protein